MGARKEPRSAALRLHRLRLSQPTEKLVIQIIPRTHLHVMSDATRSNPFSADDSLLVDFPIKNKTNAQIAAPDGNSAEMVLADEIDRRLDRVHSQRSALLQRATKLIEEQPELRVLAAKVVVDAVHPAGVGLVLLGKLPTADGAGSR